jgi:transcription initiation factor IIE alpha subunit
MRSNEIETKRLVRIERATGIDRKDLRPLLERLTESELIERIEQKGRGRGGHALVYWKITEVGRVWRSDIGRFIQLCQKMNLYPEEFFYLPSDQI